MLQRKLEVRLTTITLLTLCFFIWPLLFFIGYFFASNPIFYLIAFALALLIGFSAYKTSKKLALTLSIITVTVIVCVFHFGFEEAYCSEKGHEADVVTGGKMVTATKEDAAVLKGFEVKEGSKIGINFRTHMLCHSSFSMAQTFTESLHHILSKSSSIK